MSTVALRPHGSPVGSKGACFAITPTAAQIFEKPSAPAVWPPSRDVTSIAIDVLPTIGDDLIADLVEHLIRTIVDREDELRAVRAVSSAALEFLYTKGVEIDRQHKRLGDLLDAHRRERAAEL